MRALVVEDDPDLAEVLRQGLTEEGYAVDLSLDGEDGLWRATTVDYDVMVLDVMLPRIGGLDLLARMRSAGRMTPVLLLTARDGAANRASGLDAGADDYVVKPFAWEELLARLRALLRRGAAGGASVIRYGDLSLCPARHEVSRSGRVIDLTAMEFRILHVLIRSPERVFSRSEISEHVYDDEHDSDSNVLEVLVSRLRRKLTVDGEAPLIRTVRGVGYALQGGSHA